MTEYEPVDLDFIRSYDPDPETDPKMVAEAVRLINEAQKPLVLVGQGVELGNAQEELRAFVEKGDMPCGCTLLGLSALPSGHRLNKGMLGMHGNLGPNVKTNECDVLIAVGMRFDDRVTGKLETYARQAKVIHLDVDLRNRQERAGGRTGAGQLQAHAGPAHRTGTAAEAYGVDRELQALRRERVRASHQEGGLPRPRPRQHGRGCSCGERGHAERSGSRYRRGPEPDDGLPVFPLYEEPEHRHFGRHGHDGILPARCHRSLFRMPGTHRVRIHGRRACR